MIFDHSPNGITGPFKGIRTAFHVVSPHQTRNLECFADSSNVPWNPLTVLRPDLIATILQMCLHSFCALLFLQSHLSPICVALTYNDSRIIPHKTCQVQGIVSVHDFGFPDRLQEIHYALPGLLRRFCFARVGL